MTDPVTAISLGSMALSAGGSIASGIGTSNADKYQAEQLEQAAQYGEVKATQTNATLTRNLSQTLANIDAVRAAAKTDPTSPTGAAVRNQTEAVGAENKNIQVDSIMAQARQDEDQAAYLRSASSDALLMGGLKAGAGVLGGIAGIPGLNGMLGGSAAGLTSTGRIAGSV